MGSKLEFNDTLVLTTKQGFPVDVLNFDAHLKQPLKAEHFKDKTFHFAKDEARVFHIDPTRVFLVQNIGGKWLHWGHILIQSQTIEKVFDINGRWHDEWTTSGTFTISKIYHPDYQKIIAETETPAGKSYL